MAIFNSYVGLPEGTPKWFDLYPADNCCFPHDFPMISPVFPHDFPILLPFFSLTILPSPTHEWQAKSVLSVAWPKNLGISCPKVHQSTVIPSPSPNWQSTTKKNPQILIDSVGLMVPSHYSYGESSGSSINRNCPRSIALLHCCFPSKG